MPVEDYKRLVSTLDREQFAEEFPYPFLLTTASLRSPISPRATLSMTPSGGGDFDDETTEVHDVFSPRDLLKPRLVIRPVLKIRDTFPNMIMVGRTANNDIVLADISISKFHAFFSKTDDGMAVVDSGSSNGTFIAGKRLPARGEPTSIVSGDVIKIGQVELSYFDAGELWDRVWQLA